MEGATGQGSSVRILLPAGRPQFAPPIWESRELRSPPHALGAGSGRACPKSQGVASKLGVSLNATPGVLCQTTPRRAAPKKGRKKAPWGLFCELTQLLGNQLNRAIKIGLPYSQAARSHVGWAAAQRPYMGGTHAPCFTCTKGAWARLKPITLLPSEKLSYIHTYLSTYHGAHNVVCVLWYACNGMCALPRPSWTLSLLYLFQLPPWATYRAWDH